MDNEKLRNNLNQLAIEYDKLRNVLKLIQEDNIKK